MKQKSRLKKIALMPEQMFESTLDQVSDKGRAILKAIEDYKFNLDQTMRVVKNDQALTNIIQQKKKNLDHAAQDLYNIVFEIENIDISAAYNEQQETTQENSEGGENKEQTPQNSQPQQGQPQNAPSDNEATPPVGGGSGGTPATPSSEPKEDGEQKEDAENKDSEEKPEGDQSKDDSKPTPEKPEEEKKK